MASKMIPRRRQIPDLSKNSNLVGPANPVSNLRPVYFAPLFPVSSWNAGTSPHPYSLNELHSTVALPPQLVELRETLAAEDLQYRMMLSAHEKRSITFWSDINTRYAVAKAQSDMDEDDFDRLWSQDHQAEYRTYHRLFYKGQFGLVWPSAKAEWRRLKWRAACWRAGVDSGLA